MAEREAHMAKDGELGEDWRKKEQKAAQERAEAKAKLEDGEASVHELERL